MEEHIVRILSIQPVSHDTRQYRVEKPAGYSFVPGQATEISLSDPAWQQERRPFTFTGRNEDPFLEFVIKSYPEHHGVTEQFLHLHEGDQVLIHDVWGAIQYQQEGVFLAGGAGITPFLAIFRQLHQQGELGTNRLLYSNKTYGDILFKNELDEMLGSNVSYTLTRETSHGISCRKMDESFLEEQISDFSQPFYLCGPDQMVHDLKAALKRLGADDELITVEL